MTKSRVKCTNNVLKKVQADKKKNYKRIVIKESSDEEDDYDSKEEQSDKKKNYRRIVSEDSSDEEDVNSNKVSSIDSRKSSIVAQIQAINYQHKLQELCDSESDDENGQPINLRKRKLNCNNKTDFGSDNVTPKKITRVVKRIDSSFVKQHTNLLVEQEPVFKHTFLKNTGLKIDPDHMRELAAKDCLRVVLEDIGLSKIKTLPTEQLPTRKNSEDPTVRKSFLASLSEDVPLENADSKATNYRINYNSSRVELCKVLYKLYNKKVFDNKLPADMRIEWNGRLQCAAGKCYNKKHYNVQREIINKSSKIGLSTKILTSPDTLRDILIHEMCHAATWLINNVSSGHGSFWQAWTNKAMKVFPELPVISRCHGYKTHKKYTYRCISCGYRFGRVRRSLHLRKIRCGKCHGKFELFRKVLK